MPDGRLRVAIAGRPGTLMSHMDRDTWPTLNGKYHPNHPGDRAWELIRWDDWPDDEWVRVTLVRPSDG
jgi:hypothetical protein